MVEIAISLAIIGIALVSIIGVLPIGMNTQRDNREETIINQDATVFMEAIRNGARGLDDLTNYVYAVTNSWVQYNASGVAVNKGTNGYSYTSASVNVSPMTPPLLLTNGMNIIGLLSMPEFTDASNFRNPTNNLFSGGYSNHVVAYVRAMSGLAAEKPPQNNGLMLANTFSYRVLCANLPVAVDTNQFFYATSNYVNQLTANLHEVRLTFFWPQLPNGNLGPGQQTFRTQVAGQVINTNVMGVPPLPLPNVRLYFYQPQTFVNVAN